MLRADDDNVGNGGDRPFHEHSPEVHLAAGMVCAQAHCDSLAEALGLMQQRADEQRVGIDDVAVEVLEHRFRFDRHFRSE
jgi:hypothetical protein